MENANGEFVWLSGPAHRSIAQEAQSNDSSKKLSQAKPLPHPRQQNVQSDASSHGTASFERPTPSPRAPPRTDSKPVYEVPPSLHNSIFYVATPKTTDEEPRPPQTFPRVDRDVIREFDPMFQDSKGDRGQSVFYVNPVIDSSLKKVTAPGLNQVLMAMQEGSVTGIPSSTSTPHFKSNNTGGPSLGGCSSSSVGYDCNRENTQSVSKKKVSRSASSSSSLSILSRNSTLLSTASAPANFHGGGKEEKVALSSPTTQAPLQIPPLITTSLPKNYCLASGVNLNISGVEIETNPNKMCQNLSQPLSFPGSQVIPQSSRPMEQSDTQKRTPPIPKPRKLGAAKAASPESPPRTNKNKLKCTLSTVPPPPQPYVRRQLGTEAQPVVRESISVENPFYMFVEGASANASENQRTNLSNSDYKDDSSSSSTDGDFETPPPAFPPPPLPTLSNNGFATQENRPCADTRKVSSDFDFDTVEPCAPLGISTGSLQNVGKVATPVETKIFSSSADPPRADSNWRKIANAAPVYQNIVELYNNAREGVYAKINKMGKPDAAEMPSPPPLPPRQQQAPPPPRIYPHPPSPARSPLNESNSGDATIASQRDSITDDLREPGITHHGVLYKIGRSRKDVVQKWFQLESGNLLCFADDTQDCLQEIFRRSVIISIAKGASSKLNQELSCFELVALNKDRVQVFGARYLSECEVWIKLIVQTIAPRSAGMSSRGVMKAGKVELRNSVTGVWQRGWLVLCGKRLEVCIRDEDPTTLDLRKVILLQDFEKDPRMSDSDDGSPLFLINYPAITLYVRSAKSFDTQDWSRRIRQIMTDTGSGLDEQQLMHDGVPVIIYKCIEFVSTYGMTSQGIYRQSATNSRIAKLLDCFRKDAQGVRLQQGVDGDNYNEHEVANALKRYLRTLPDSLLTSALYQQWIAVSAAGDPSVENLVMLLQQLPEINYQTLKKIIGHLYSVSRHSDENLMTIINLAQVFGPTLFSDNQENIPNAHLEMDITSCLITNYPVLFEVSDEEIEKEEQFQKALRELREAKKAQKPAGDILVGIYVHDRSWGKCLNIKLSPTMTAVQLCKIAVSQSCRRDTIQSLSVFEVVCNGNLERPLHFSENVLTVILRWASWSEIDAKDNYLVIKKNDIFPKVLPLAMQPLSMFGELRFADNKSKNFKKMMFEFKNARLAFYKDAKISQPLGMWNIEDITWYIGAESRRPPPNNYLRTLSLTFIEHNAVVKRGSKESPYFGNTISFGLEEEFTKWLAAMLIGQYPSGIIPRNEPLDLL